MIEDTPPIFISYGREEPATSFARQLHDDLESGGINAWLDVVDIKSENFDKAIEKALKTCRALIFIVTRKSLDSQVCTDEWSFVRDAQKPVIPILIEAESGFSDLSFRLRRANGLDFREDYAQNFATLRTWIRELGTAQGRLEQKKIELARLVADQAKSPTPERFQASIEELQEDIRILQAEVDDPEGTRQRQQQKQDNALERERQQAAREDENRRARAFDRVVGRLPLEMSGERFKDRQSEQNHAKTWLTQSGVHIVTIIGRGGTGKTALACRILHDLERAHDQTERLLYLSEMTGGITLSRIFSGVGKWLGREEEFARLYGAGGPLAQRIDSLLAALERDDERHYVLLLDNLETHQDDEGNLNDDELAEFIRLVLVRASALKVLITTQIPLKIPPAGGVVTRMIDLESGLPVAYAVELLRELDFDGRAGLREADTARLETLAARLHGYPRALEATAARLTDPYLTLDGLLQQDELFTGDVTKEMVRVALDTLPIEAAQVMRALAVFNRPVSEAAIVELLQPFQNDDLTRAALRRLVRTHFVSFDPTKATHALHPIDRAHIYGQIPDESKISLARQAADYFKARQKPETEWKQLDDQDNHIAEIEQRIAAQEYATAARILNLIDFDYLLRWGYARLVKSLREPLVGKLGGDYLEAGNYGRLGIAYRNLGEARKSIEYTQQALKIARDTGNRQSEGAWLGNLGIAYRNLGEARKSIEYYEQARKIAQDIGDRRGEGALLGNLGNAYYSLGEIRKAIEYYQQALIIAQDIGDRQGEGNHTGNLGIAYYSLGEVQKAVEYYEQARKIAQDIGDQRGEGTWLGNLGIAYRQLGEAKKVIEYYEQALTITQDIGDRRSEGLWLGNLANAYSDLGEVREAIEYYDQALIIAQDISDRRAEGISLGNLGSVYRQLGQFEKATELGRRAVQIAIEVEDVRACSYRYTYLAVTLLLQGDFTDAYTHAQSATSYDVPENNDFSQTVLGIACLLRGEPSAARGALGRGLGFAEDLLAKTPGAYEALYTKGLILAALTCLGDDQKAAAQAAYAAARAIFDGAGILTEHRQLLGLLPCDVRDLLG